MQRISPLSRKRSRYSRVLTILIVLFYVLGLIFPSILWNHFQVTMPSGNKGAPLLLAPRQASWLTPAPPIAIIGDDGWAACDWVNGSGTWDKPYVLRNLTIDASGSGSCITIENTTRYFQIINCTLTRAGTGFRDAGIYLNHTGNGTLLNNTCYNNSCGIHLDNACNNNTLVDSTCTGNGYAGIFLYSSNNNTLTNNNCTGSTGNGIAIVETSCNNTLVLAGISP